MMGDDSSTGPRADAEAGNEVVKRWREAASTWRKHVTIVPATRNKPALAVVDLHELMETPPDGVARAPREFVTDPIEQTSPRTLIRADSDPAITAFARLALDLADAAGELAPLLDQHDIDDTAALELERALRRNPKLARVADMPLVEAIDLQAKRLEHRLLKLTGSSTHAPDVRFRVLAHDEAESLAHDLVAVAGRFETSVAALQQATSPRAAIASVRNSMQQVGRILCDILRSQEARIDTTPWLALTRCGRGTSVSCSARIPAWSTPERLPCHQDLTMNNQTVADLMLMLASDRGDISVLRSGSGGDALVAGFLEQHVFLEALTGWLGDACRPGIDLQLPRIEGRLRLGTTAELPVVAVVDRYPVDAPDAPKSFVGIATAGALACRHLANVVRGMAPTPTPPASDPRGLFHLARWLHTELRSIVRFLESPITHPEWATLTSEHPEWPELKAKLDIVVGEYDEVRRTCSFTDPQAKELSKRAEELQRPMTRIENALSAAWQDKHIEALSTLRQAFAAAVEPHALILAGNSNGVARQYGHWTGPSGCHVLLRMAHGLIESHRHPNRPFDGRGIGWGVMLDDLECEIGWLARRGSAPHPALPPTPQVSHLKVGTHAPEAPTIRAPSGDPAADLVLDPIEKAIALLMRDGRDRQSMRKYATLVGTTHSRLSRSKKWQKAWAATKPELSELPEGTKDADGNLDAWKDEVCENCRQEEIARAITVDGEAVRVCEACATRLLRTTSRTKRQT